MFFSKWHALGNDFVLIALDSPKPSPRLIRALGDRKTGVGFDQLLFFSKSNKADYKLQFFNADGSQAELCGNGLRAAALSIWAKKGRSAKPLTFETKSGIRTATSQGNLVEIDMGVPKALPLLSKNGIAVQIGNPHFVVLGKTSLSADELKLHGEHFSNHPAFKRGTNVEFVIIQNRNQIHVQVYERGVGVTDACGSGAVASVFAAIEKGLVDHAVTVKFKRGSVQVRRDSCGVYFLKGDAHFVFNGEWCAQ